MVFRTIVKFSAARRIPLIKFRRQRGEDATASVTSSQQEVGSAASVSTRPTIEDWELPTRYQRKPLDQAEIDYINRGGPA